MIRLTTCYRQDLEVQYYKRKMQFASFQLANFDFILTVNYESNKNLR